MHENVHMSGNDAMHYVSMCNSLWNVEFASTCMWGTMAWVKYIDNQAFQIDFLRCCCNFETIDALLSMEFQIQCIHMVFILGESADGVRWIICPNADCSNSTNGIFSLNALVTFTFTHHLLSLRCWLSLLFPYDFRFQFKLWQMKRNFNSFENWIVHSNAWKSAVQFIQHSSHSHSTENAKQIKFTRKMHWF